jgi:hypothetical protein
MTNPQLARYEQAIQIARDLLDPNLSTAELESDENQAYGRALVEFIAGLWPLPGVAADAREREVEIDLGLREPPMVLLRIPERDWSAINMMARGTPSPGILFGAISKLSEAEVVADGPAAVERVADDVEAICRRIAAFEEEWEHLASVVKEADAKAGPSRGSLAPDTLAAAVRLARELKAFAQAHPSQAQHVQHIQAWLRREGFA